MHPPEPPDHAADTPRPTQPTLPHKAVRGARARLAAPPAHCSSSSRLPRAGPVTGVTSGVVQLRCAVEEVVGD
eukprot:6661763-Prymnesium_polylepis.1